MESFLTEIQIRVLNLRKKGHTQEEIAHVMGTSRANISMVEKRARENIEKAKNTLNIYNDIIAPSKIKVEKGTDVFNIPNVIFSKSDEEEIHVNYSSLQIMEFINQNAKRYIKNRMVVEPFIITILQNGEIYVHDFEEEKAKN
ncbi:DNA binding protein, Tfx family [Methanococcus vannielii SB]|jgi:Tfx family DNA-binding protein|uniref:Putative transcriptional regulatory protein Mevan_1098 n=1 Tax=Methanococcus vannielii (strain ATCC 35089 / DSM 1224 / JCM 13029 / OCM 148 / SB) TaxID=406327 RepID=Y1098_METVS|nr:Tfx family DNA-binding protein [Methanococcus vannielii]A6UR76.1 RecName: Full=Putative transcriptional regulatory protein Mevan_1098 [Methanococcus vannielii SB]ABR54998.1 DNA binding protein, Tfx family [Methanococcus vannielii SB]